MARFFLIMQKLLAELGQFTQADADMTINKLRNRNIKKNNIGAVLPKLPPMTVSGNDVLGDGVADKRS